MLQDDLFVRTPEGFEVFQPRGAQAQVVWRERGGQVLAGDLSVAAQLEMQRVVPVDQGEDGLQQVIAVRPAPGDVQKEIELGGCRHVVDGLHGDHFN